MTMFCTKLSHRSLLHVEGDDAAHFLQGLITNDIHKATEDQAVFALMLTPQGKYLFDFYIIKRGNGFLLDAPVERIDSLVKKLSLYKLRSKVTITPQDQAVIYAVWPDSGSNKLDLDQVYFPDPRHASLGYRIADAERTFKPESLESAEFSQYEHHRIAQGIPDPSIDMEYEKSFPLQYLMEEFHAIDYKKGCYVGQEVTARTHWKGTVRKSLFTVRGASDLPESGADVRVMDKRIGELRTAIGGVGLILADVEKVKQTPLYVGEVPVELVVSETV